MMSNPRNTLEGFRCYVCGYSRPLSGQSDDSGLCASCWMRTLGVPEDVILAVGLSSFWCEMDGHGQCRSQSLQKPDGGKLRDCDQHGDESNPERGDTSDGTVQNHSLNVTDTPLNYIQGEYQTSSQSQEQKEPFEHSLQVSRHGQDSFTVQIQGQKTVFSSQVYDATGHVRPAFYQWSPLHDDTVKSEGNSSVPGIYRWCPDGCRTY